MRLKLFCVLCTVLLIGCGEGQQPVAVTHVATLDFSGAVFATEATQVVHDQGSWQILWSQMNQLNSEPPALPAVDFTKNVVLVAAAGVRPSSGFSVSITGATESSSGAVTVNVLITSPGSGCGVAAVITSPVDMSTIPAPSGTVEFAIKRQVKNC